MTGGVNANGTYKILTAGTSGPGGKVVLQGLGTETGNDGSSPVKVVMNVWADSAKVDNTQTN